MSGFFIKISRIVLFLTLAGLFISNGSFNNSVLPIAVLEASYALRSSGFLNEELKGVMRFESKLETTDDGTSFSTLKMNLNSCSDGSGHTLGFLISEKNNQNGLCAGTYTVKNKIDGFLGHFNGVFGFADIKKKGETPFFANNGQITIYNADKEKISGAIAVNLQNSSGKNISIKGNFTTKKTLKK